MPIAVIDMGHGGRDPGSVGKNTYEKNNNLTLGLKVGTILSQHGITVYYTRSEDRDFCSGNFNDAIDLQNRIALAKVYNPDIFVSCHNDAFDKQAKGITTYCHKLGGTDEQLAKDIQDELAKLPFQNRGVRTKTLYVTKKWDGTKTSACLVEYGFLDSEEDAILANMDKASVAIAKGILGFLGIQYQGEVQGVNKYMKNLVSYFGDGDREIALDYSNYLACPLILASQVTPELSNAVSGQKYQVGGGSAPSGFKLLAGNDRFDTKVEVLKEMGKI